MSRTHPGKRGDCGAFSPHLPRAGEAQPPGGLECCPREAGGRSPAQVHSGELLNTQSLRFSICKMETITPVSSGLLAKSTRGPGCHAPVLTRSVKALSPTRPC